MSQTPDPKEKSKLAAAWNTFATWAEGLPMNVWTHLAAFAVGLLLGKMF